MGVNVNWGYQAPANKAEKHLKSGPYYYIQSLKIASHMDNFHSTLNRTSIFNDGFINMGFFYDLQCFKKYKLSKDSLKNIYFH